MIRRASNGCKQRWANYGKTSGSTQNIGSLCREGRLDKALQVVDLMEQQGVAISRDIFHCLLQGCITNQDLVAGRRIHFLLVNTGLDSVSFLGDHLIRLFASCGGLQDANQVFLKVSNPTVYTWNAIISAYAKLGEAEKTFQLYCRMQEKGVKPSRVTFLCILKICGSICAMGQGKLIHDQIVRNGLESDLIIGNTLVDVYSKWGNLKEAYVVFDGLSNRDVVSWGAMIAGYAQHGQGLVALELFGRMQHWGLKPNSVIFLCILKACGSIGALVQGRLVHEQATRNGIEYDVTIVSTVVDMYAKCGSLDEARRVFDKMLRRNVVSWGAMIAGYVQIGDGLPALELFQTMKQDDIKPDNVIFSSILKACCSIGAIGQGRLIHTHIIRSGHELDLVLRNTLVDMYAKCGSLEETCKVFGSMPSRDKASWGSIISAFASYGNCRLAWQYLKDMECQGLKPGDSIFTSILFACSNAGLIEVGQCCFKTMREDYGVTASTEHYNCMVELLSRTGHLEEAEYLLQTMPIPPDITGCTSLLTSCRTYGNVDIGRWCFDRAAKLDPSDASGFVLMSNIYADADMWGAADEVLIFRQHVHAPKKPGRAWIQIGNKVCEFIVARERYPQSDEFFYKFRRLCKVMKEESYMPQLELVLQICP